MGIPRFYRWLKARYPQIRVDLTDQQKQIPLFDNFYIDFNALIYQCIRQSGCFLKNKVRPLTFQQITQRVIKYLHELVKIVNPQKLIYIALDGVAPRAKINQSRDRRFKSGIEDIEFFQNLVEKLEIKTEENFQSNSISPGTEFLYNLCVDLKKKIMEYVTSEWKDLLVMFSDCCVPGQGEHKIMDFLRYSNSNKLFNQNTTYCVYSPDADVILLTLSLNIEYICIIKEDTSVLPSQSWTASSTYRKSANPKFQFVMINILREYLEKQFEGVLTSIKGCHLQSIIDDFVLLMAFVGNDFLPNQFCFVLKDGHMDNLLKSFKEYLIQNKQFMNKGGNIDWKNVSKLLKIAQIFEARMIGEMKQNRRKSGGDDISHYDRKQNQESIFDDQTQRGPNDKNAEKQEDDMNAFQVKDDRLIKGVDHYYKTRFNITSKSPQLEKIIGKYIEGLEFYCQYYYKGLPSWSWYYPYHYTPLLCDVYQYLQYNIVNVSISKGQPFDPILALMFMLPEQNFNLLPKPVSQALKNPNCILKTPIDYFPRKFKLDPFESLKYNKHAIIQFLKEDDVRKVYESIPKTAYTKQQNERNTKNDTFLFLDKDGMPYGVTLSFNQKAFAEVKAIIQRRYQGKEKNSNQRRFPTLSIYGKWYLNEGGKLVPQFRYKYQGNPSQIVFFNSFLGFVQDSEKCTEQWKQRIEPQYQKIGIAGNCDNYFIVKRARFVREINRYNLVSTNKTVIVPDFALCKAPNYDYIHKVQEIDWKKNYKLNERVAVLSQQYFGFIGVITQLNQKKVKVKLIKHPLFCQDRIEELEDTFYTLDYVSKKLSVNQETLLTIMGEIIVLPSMSSKKQFNERLPTALNFGLNFIDFKNKKIVPRFVRYQLQKIDRIENILKEPEISAKGIQILTQYIHQFGWLIEYLEEGNSVREIRARNIFNESKGNIKLYKQFIKLYQLENKGVFYSIYSKVAHSLDYNIATDTSKPLATVQLNYYEIISRSEALKCPPSYRQQPEYHGIGDRVIVLNTLEIGWIVGIDDHFFFVAIGKQKRIVKVGFTEIYNQKWESALSKDFEKSWNLEPSYFTPSYYGEAKS